MNKSATKKSPVILLVEDDALIRKITRDELTASGFTVHEAADGKTALEIILKRKLDLVLLDILLPEKDGLSILRELKAKKKIPQLPVYILTSLGDMEKVAEGVTLGARGYFVKQDSGREEMITTVKQFFQKNS